MSTAAAISYEPVASLTVTPLIDVLLVLIVMFILCLPLATHEVPIDLPGGTAPPSDAPVHRLSLDAGGAARWDGVAIDAASLTARLHDAAASDAQLVFAPDARTRFVVVDRTLAAVKRAGVTRLGFEGNERYAAF